MVKNKKKNKKTKTIDRTLENLLHIFVYTVNSVLSWKYIYDISWNKKKKIFKFRIHVLVSVFWEKPVVTVDHPLLFEFKKYMYSLIINFRFRTAIKILWCIQSYFSIERLPPSFFSPVKLFSRMLCNYFVST